MCFDVVGKSVDSDTNLCGSGRRCLLQYALYSDEGDGDMGEFAHMAINTQLDILKTMDESPVPPTPAEYLSECTCWLDYSNVARYTTTCGRALSLFIKTEPIASETLFLCDAVAFVPESTEYSSWEIAACASFIASETARSAPQVERIETPALSSLWSSVPWTRGYKLCKLMRSAPGRVFGIYGGGNAGLSGIYPEKFVDWCCRGKDEKRKTSKREGGSGVK